MSENLAELVEEMLATQSGYETAGAVMASQLDLEMAAQWQKFTSIVQANADSIARLMAENERLILALQAFMDIDDEVGLLTEAHAAAELVKACNNARAALKGESK